MSQNVLFCFYWKEQRSHGFCRYEDWWRSLYNKRENPVARKWLRLSVNRSLHGKIEINVSVSRSVSLIWLDRKPCITYICFCDFYRSDGKSPLKRKSEKVNETPFTLSAPEVAPTIAAWSPVQDYQLRAQRRMTGQRLPTRLMLPYAFITW